MDSKYVLFLFAVCFCAVLKTTTAQTDQILTNRTRPTRRPAVWDPLWNGQRKPFNPAWMDYCNPGNCNAYHKTSCGLNRSTMRFKYFQSDCHIILNNKCAAWRGTIKYDIISVKYCYAYVMQVRSKCPTYCDQVPSPVCAVSSNGSAVLFLNDCALEVANCATVIPGYEEVKMEICEYYLRQGVNEMIKV